MNQSEITNRIEQICNEFDIRVKDVGLAVARLELAKALADSEASQQADPPAPKNRCTCKIVVPKGKVGTINRVGCPVHPGG